MTHCSDFEFSRHATPDATFPTNMFEHGLDGHCFRGQWVLAHWFVLSCIHSLRVSPLHVRFLDFSRSHQEEERVQIPAEF